MKFVDEATVEVEAGRGGDGCVSFRREKYVPRGGPDGGNGGHGGSVFLIAREGINTLVDFRVRRRYRAKSGRGGAGKERTGASGEDLYISVPKGTVVCDLDTALESKIRELARDLFKPEHPLKIQTEGRYSLGPLRMLAASCEGDLEKALKAALANRDTFSLLNIHLEPLDISRALKRLAERLSKRI